MASQNFGKPMVRKGSDVSWDSHVLRGESPVESSGGEGYPLLDSSGERMLFLIDYIRSQRDESIASARNRIFLTELELPLSEGTWTGTREFRHGDRYQVSARRFFSNPFSLSQDV